MADQIPRAAATRHGMRTRRLNTISRFRAVTKALTAGADLNHVIQEYPEDQTTTLYTPDNDRQAGRVFMYCMGMIRASGENNQEDLIGLYASAISSVFRGEERAVRYALKQMGIAVEEVKLPSQATQFNLQIPEDSDFPSVLVMAGQLFLIPFKNISLASYDNFMVRRAQDLKARTGCFLDVNVTEYLSRRQAEIIKSGIGSILTFKRDLLKAINDFSGGTGAISNMCNYLLEIIAWTDMAALVVIRDMLLVPGSPVLRDARVASEVLALGAAYREVYKVPQPQFFRILGDAHLHHLLNRNNFPILHAVASRLRAESSRSATQFVPTLNREHRVVLELCGLHKAANIEIQGAKFRQNLQFLTNFTEEEMAE